MEAGTGGTPAAPQTDELMAKLNVLANGVEAMRARVNGDLEALKAEVQAEHDAHDELDLTVVLERIDIIIATVSSIDPSSELPPEQQPGQQQPPADTPPVEQPPAGEVPPPVEEPPVETPPEGNGDGVPTEPTPGEQGDTVPPPADTGVARALYTYDGDPSEVDTNEWQPSGLQSPDGQPLFFYVMDDPQTGTANGDGAGGVWHVYQGPTVAAEEG